MSRTQSDEIDQALRWFKITSLYVFLAVNQNRRLTKLYRLLRSSDMASLNTGSRENDAHIIRFASRWKDFMNIDAWNPPSPTDLNQILPNLSLIAKALSRDDLSTLQTYAAHDEYAVLMVNLRRPSSLIMHFISTLIQSLRTERGIIEDMVIYRPKRESLTDREEYLETYLKYLSNGRQIEPLVLESLPDISDRRRAADQRKKIRQHIQKAETIIKELEQLMLQDSENICSEGIAQ